MLLGWFGRWWSTFVRGCDQGEKTALSPTHSKCGFCSSHNWRYDGLKSKWTNPFIIVGTKFLLIPESTRRNRDQRNWNSSAWIFWTSRVHLKVQEGIEIASCTSWFYLAKECIPSGHGPYGAPSTFICSRMNWAVWSMVSIEAFLAKVALACPWALGRSLAHFCSALQIENSATHANHHPFLRSCALSKHGSVRRGIHQLHLELVFGLLALLFSSSHSKGCRTQAICHNRREVCTTEVGDIRKGCQSKHCRLLHLLQWCTVGLRASVGPCSSFKEEMQLHGARAILLVWATNSSKRSRKYIARCSCRTFSQDCFLCSFFRAGAKGLHEYIQQSSLLLVTSSKLYRLDTTYTRCMVGVTSRASCRCRSVSHRPKMWRFSNPSLARAQLQLPVRVLASLGMCCSCTLSALCGKCS